LCVRPRLNRWEFSVLPAASRARTGRLGEPLYSWVPGQCSPGRRRIHEPQGLVDRQAVPHRGSDNPRGGSRDVQVHERRGGVHLSSRRAGGRNSPPRDPPSAGRYSPRASAACRAVKPRPADAWLKILRRFCRSSAGPSPVAAPEYSSRVRRPATLGVPLAPHGTGAGASDDPGRDGGPGVPPRCVKRQQFPMATQPAAGSGQCAQADRNGASCGLLPRRLAKAHVVTAPRPARGSCAHAGIQHAERIAGHHSRDHACHVPADLCGPRRPIQLWPRVVSSSCQNRGGFGTGYRNRSRNPTSSRRNLSPDQTQMLLGRRYNRAKKRTPNPECRNQHGGVAPQSEGRHTADKLAAQHGVSRATVERAGQFANGALLLGLQLGERSGLRFVRGGNRNSCSDFCDGCRGVHELSRTAVAHCPLLAAVVLERRVLGPVQPRISLAAALLRHPTTRSSGWRRLLAWRWRIRPMARASQLRLAQV
jgi:hypothetical protein